MEFKLGLIRQENHKNSDEKQSCGGFEAPLGSLESRCGRMIVGVGGGLVDPQLLYVAICFVASRVPVTGWLLCGGLFGEQKGERKCSVNPPDGFIFPFSRPG